MFPRVNCSLAGGISTYILMLCGLTCVVEVICISDIYSYRMEAEKGNSSDFGI